MTIFQIAAAIFGLFMLYVVNIHHRKQRFSRVEQFFWLSLWSVFIVIALFPALLTGLTTTLKFSRVFDLLVVAALMVLTVLVISSYFIQRENSKKLEDLIREMAIKQKK